ncbi:MAG: 16S rRNA (uracil(1498)-N(3))-methyltransferase [bacterium]
MTDTPNPLPSPRTRIHVPGAGESLLFLEDADSLAVSRTLRLQPGDPVAGFNGDGMEYHYRVVQATRGRLTLELERSEPNPRDQLPSTTIFAAATKGKGKDRAARDLPPLGVTRLVFYRAGRTIGEPSEAATPRLQKIAIEACRQCGRSTIPAVDVRKHSLPELYQAGEFSSRQTLWFWEAAGDTDPWSSLAPDGPLALIFGPEGGFSPEEIAWLQSLGIPVAALGRRILRAELAAVVGLTLVQARRGLFTQGAGSGFGRESL